MSTFGEISWSDDVFGDKKNGKDLFLRLVEGSNEVRLITQPYQYSVHKVKKDPNDKKDFGQKVNCSAIHGSCPLCEEGDKPKQRWLLGVITRSTGAYKILDVSFAVFSQIRKYAKNTQRWGDPMKYDIDIVVDKNGGATGYYSVQGISKSPLSAADQVLKDNVDLDDLKRRVSPPTPEFVAQRAEKIRGGDSATAAAATKQVKPQVKASPQSMTDDDELDEFPAYDS